MVFDADAYAEGISLTAAGGSIETLVDTIDETVRLLGSGSGSLCWACLQEVTSGRMAAQDTACGHKAGIADNWKALRAAIVRRENENGEDTSFAETEEKPDAKHP